jgi:hypothetical protein
VLLAAGCGSKGNGGTSRDRSIQEQAIAYARCLRSHGVPKWPDPDSSGAFEKSKLSLRQLEVSSAELEEAQSACQRLLPNGGPGRPTQRELQRAWNGMRAFAHCMRARGVQNFPDPTASPQHAERPTFDLQPLGIDPNNPEIAGKVRVCEPLLNDASSLQNLGLSDS